MSLEEKKKRVRLNKTIAIILGVVALGSATMAVVWFTIYAPIILER